MKAAAAWWAKVDLDSIFAYSVPRTVAIRDRNLGLLQYACMAAIVAYIIGYTVVFEQRYRLIATDIFGSARLQLVGPSSNFTLLPNETTYCLTDNGGAPLPPRPGNPPMVQRPCRYLNTYGMVYPEEEASAMLVATRITETNYTRFPGCDGFPLPSCGYNETARTTYYVGGPVELATLKIDHTMSSQSLKLSKSTMEMKGKIFNTKSEQLDPCAPFLKAGGHPCPPLVAFGQEGATDIIPLQTLLDAAGKSDLDDGDYTPPVTGNGVSQISSFRNAGIVLLVSLIYSNAYQDTGSWKEEDYQYVLRATHVPKTQFKVEQVLPAPGMDTADGHLTILNRHGIRIIVKQSGNVGKFDAATMLVTLTSSLGLLAAAAMVVSFVALYLLPLRHVYRQYMTTQTVNFGAMRRVLPESDLARFAKEDLINPLPRVFEEAGVPPPWVSSAAEPPPRGVDEAAALLQGGTGAVLGPLRYGSDAVN